MDLPFEKPNGQVEAALMHVACAADAAYVPHCAAMLDSLIRQHPPSQLSIHFLYDEDLPAALLAQLGDFVQAAGANWQPLRVGRAQQVRFPANRRFGRVAWYRVLLPDLLSELDRVLYLDADVIVTDNLFELWHQDIGENALAGVCNPLYPFMKTDFMQSLGLSDPAQYFNSGVLLMDLARFRHENLVQALLDYAHQQGAGQEWPDQNALNAVLRGRCYYLPPRWNAQNTLYDLPLRKLPFTAGEVRQARRAPCIVHFIGPYKPWHYRCKHPWRQLYWEHLWHTPWRSRPMDGITLKHRLLRLLPEQFGWRLEAWMQRLRGLMGRLMTR